MAARYFFALYQYRQMVFLWGAKRRGESAVSRFALKSIDDTL